MIGGKNVEEKKQLAELAISVFLASGRESVRKSVCVTCRSRREEGVACSELADGRRGGTGGVGVCV